MMKAACETNRKNNPFKEWVGKNSTSIMPVAVILVMITVFQVINPFYLQYQGIVSLLYSMSYFLIVACGLTFVIMMGSFDFSVVSVFKFSALLCVIYIDQIGLWVVPLALLVSALFGFINGVIFTKLKVPSFLATLGISIVIEGIALYMSKGFLRMMSNEVFRSLSVTFIGGLPSIFYWAIAVVIVCTLVAFITPFGRRIFAIGGNPAAAAHSGINVTRTRISVFMLCSLLAGFGGILYMAQLGGGSMAIGADMSIPLFASVVAGGTTLSGGVGGPHRTLLGVVIITWMQTGLLMLGIGKDIQVVVFGFIAIIMSIVTTDRQRIKIIK
jgi:ribose transport system permease protein